MFGWTLLNRRSLAGWTKPEPSKMELSVAYMGPLAALSYHLEGLTPLTPVATHRLGFKFTQKANLLYKIMKKKVMLPPHQFLLNSIYVQ